MVRSTRWPKGTRTGIVDDVDDEIEQPTELYWDDVVDVICAGTGPGALAQAIVCADLGLERGDWPTRSHRRTCPIPTRRPTSRP